MSIIFAGFTGLHLNDQMNLLQMTWLDVLCFNLSYRSTPYRGLLIFADDFRNSEEESEKFGTPTQLNIVTRRLSKKMSDLNVTRDEYVFLKAMVLLNPGKSPVEIFFVVVILHPETSLSAQTLTG
jgi:Ligand-binding domain of nuclear hormone receptor